MNKAIVEVILRLDPMDDKIFINQLPRTEENDWLENDKPELLADKAYAASIAISDSVTDAGSTSGVVHRCDYLRISAVEGGYELKTAQSDVLLYEGDVIKLPTGCFRVALEQQYVVPAEVKADVVNAVPDFDDIWSTEEVHHTNAYMADPFTNTAIPTRPSVIPPIQNAHLSAATIPDAFTLSPPRPQDPLHFLYDTPTRESAQQPQFIPQVNTNLPPYSLLQTSNFSSSQAGQGNNDLTSHAQPAYMPNAAPMAETELDKSSYLDQSPMDRLDEYLGADDDYYPRPQPVLPSSNIYARVDESSYTANAVQSQTLESKRGFLTSVKQAMKRGHN